MKKADISFEKRVLGILTHLKNEKKDPASSPVIPVYEKNTLKAYLRVASISSLENKEEIANLAGWREKHAWWFPDQFTVTIEGTRTWFEKQVIKKKDRFLFILETPSGIPFGHMGFYRFNFSNKSCEIDNVVRGLAHQPGAMTVALLTLCDWAFTVLQMKTLFLTVFTDNTAAIKLYRRCGFTELKKIPLKKIVKADRVSWVTEQEVYKGKSERYFLQMKKERP